MISLADIEKLRQFQRNRLNQVTLKMHRGLAEAAKAENQLRLAENNAAESEANWQARFAELTETHDVCGNAVRMHNELQFIMRTSEQQKKQFSERIARATEELNTKTKIANDLRSEMTSLSKTIEKYDHLYDEALTEETVLNSILEQLQNDELTSFITR